MTLNERIFREYDIRGVADRDLTDAVVDDLGLALAAHMRSRGVKTVALARDCRLSSPRLKERLLKAFLASGLDVTDIGVVTTPLLYFAVFEYGLEGGVMVTGSHNPGEHNGFKICIGRATIHGEEILKIRDLMKKKVRVSGEGKLNTLDVIPHYIDYVTETVKLPKPLKIVVDHGNGMSSVVAGDLFRRLGCEVIELFKDLDGTFPNHHPDPTVLENLKILQEQTRKHKAAVGIAFDGDADRIGVVDKDGRVLFGDELLVLFSRAILKKNPGAKIISEVKASHRLFNDIEKQGGVPILWKTGHSLIKAKMKEEGALLAGEMSGHMFFSDRYFGYDDAVYAAARLLEILSETGKSPWELLADLPGSHCTPEIRVDCPDEIKFDVVAKARTQFENQGLKVNGIDGARVEFKDGWGLVRASNTQPVLVFRFEASSEKRLEEIRSSMESVVTNVLSKTVSS